MRTEETQERKEVINLRSTSRSLLLPASPFFRSVLPTHVRLQQTSRLLMIDVRRMIESKRDRNYAHNTAGSCANHTSSIGGLASFLLSPSIDLKAEEAAAYAHALTHSLTHSGQTEERKDWRGDDAHGIVCSLMKRVHEWPLFQLPLLDCRPSKGGNI